MDTPAAAARLASLGHELRLELFRLLVQAGGDGLAVGELQSLVDRPASTVAFHLRELVGTELVTQEKVGRVIRCHANFDALGELMTYLQDDCCRGITLSAFAPSKAG